jgi:hypothetical protein
VPVVLRFEGYRFFFFSNEGDPREPVHIHIRKAEKVAKFWLDPAVIVADSYGMTSRELARLAQVVAENRDLFVRRWDEYFGN